MNFRNPNVSRSLGAMFVALLLPAAVLGQTQNAQINGTITDQSGAVVTAAEISVTNVDTLVERTNPSTATGNYVVLNLIPGNYTVEVSSPGFQTSSAVITLDVNQTATLDFQLEVGAVTETVEVVAEGAQLESTTAQLGTVVTEEKIEELPLNGRNFTQLITLTPGATPVSVGQNRGGAQVQQIGVISFPSINGQQNRANHFSLDGVYNNGHFMGTYGIAPNVDALSQFKVQSHSDRAEIGGVAGGVINIATKSGTNEFHGTAYEFLRNDALDARGFFTASKPSLRFNQYGATVGGPIAKEKTFFFFSYEGFRRVNPSSRLVRIPTRAELGGDFSADSRPIFDPFTTREDPNDPNRFVRDSFTNNTIPTSMFNASTKAWADTVIPAPEQTSVPRFNHRNTDSQDAPADQFNVRVDQNFSPKDFLWFRATWGDQNRTVTQAIQGTTREIGTPAMNIGASYTHIFGANTVASGLFGFNTLTQVDRFLLTERDLIGEGLFEGMAETVNAPGMAIPSAFGSVDGRIRKLGPQKAWQFRGDLSHVTGNHTIKFGGELVVQPWQNIQDNPTYSFLRRQTADLNNLANTGNDIASFLLGVHERAISILADFALESQLWNFYVQDTWRVSNKLTLNTGLRWDLLGTPVYRRNAASVWDFNTGKFLVGSATPPACDAAPPPCLIDPENEYNKQHVVYNGSSKLQDDDFKMFGPRFGFAYRARPTLVVRGSYGIFFDLISGANQQAQNGSKWPGTSGVSFRGANRIFVEHTSERPFGDQSVDLPEPTPERQAGFLYDPRFRRPYSQQWNLEVQQEFSGGEVVSIGYVGSHNLRQAVTGNYNTALTPGPGPVGPRKLYPHAPVTLYDRSVGQSSYHGLQTKIERRFRGGLSYLLAYTWSKSIDVASSGQFGVESQHLQNPYDPNESKSVSGYDIPHVFSLASIYELPFGPGKRWANTGLGSRILGNWQFNTIITFRSGQPYTPEMNVDLANIGALRPETRVRPDLLRDHKLSNPTPERWFDTEAFAPPEAFTFGSAGRNILLTDSVQNFDLSLFREDQLSEDVRLQFRVEFFNAFNHPSFGIPQRRFTNPRFGQVSNTVSTARQIQFGLKLLF